MIVKQVRKTIVGMAIMSMSALVQANPSVPGELIIKLKSNGIVAQNYFQEKSNDIEVLERIGSEETRVYRIRYNLAFDSKNLIHNLSNDSRVKYVEPNYIYTINTLKPQMNSDINDPQFSSLWGMSNTGSNEPNSRVPGVVGADINALNAWKLTTGSKQIKIAIIDTGIDYNHEDLQENIWVNTAELNGKAGVDDDGNGFIDDIHGYDFANNDGDPMDDNKHGTHVAGTIGAIHNNQVGVAGVMGHVSLMAIKFLKGSGSGTLADAVKAINYATQMGVDLMSNSWGGGGFSQTMKDAIEKANEAGIVFVAASGNSGTDNDSNAHYPSNYDLPNVISVAALTAQNTLAYFSCYGRKTVHIAAPGHRILSTTPNNTYSILSGTSMATPHVSGAIGLLLSYEEGMTPAQVKERLIATSVPVSSLRSKTINAGRLDLVNLLKDARPYRNMPIPGKWKTVKVENWETSHPYLKNTSEFRTFNVPGAKFIRVKIEKLEIEKKYDYLQVLDQSRSSIEKIWGAKEMYRTDYIEGDTINVKFKSDNTVNKWGFLIKEVEVQY